MKSYKTKFEKVKLLKIDIFRDKRGFFYENFHQAKYQNFFTSKFIQDNISFSKKNVIRGLHLQTKYSQEKYVSVLKGAILDVVVDLRKESRTYGKHYKIILSDENAKSIFIPAGFAHGFLALKKENIIYYTCTNYRSAKHEVGILWNDKDLKIKWPIKKPIVSKKDKKNMKFIEFKKIY